MIIAFMQTVLSLLPLFRPHHGESEWSIWQKWEIWTIGQVWQILKVDAVRNSSHLSPSENGWCAEAQMALGQTTSWNQTAYPAKLVQNNYADAYPSLPLEDKHGDPNGDAWQKVIGNESSKGAGDADRDIEQIQVSRAECKEIRR